MDILIFRWGHGCAAIVHETKELLAMGRQCVGIHLSFCPGPRTQMTAVNQKLLPGIYFSPENVPFAQKKGIKKCSGKSSNQKVILVYQPSARMYICIPV